MNLSNLTVKWKFFPWICEIPPQLGTTDPNESAPKSLYFYTV